jgi:hypothetical protein
MSVLINALQKAAHDRANGVAAHSSIPSKAPDPEVLPGFRDRDAGVAAFARVLRTVAANEAGCSRADDSSPQLAVAASTYANVSHAQSLAATVLSARRLPSGYASRWTGVRVLYIGGGLAGVLLLAFATQVFHVPIVQPERLAVTRPRVQFAPLAAPVSVTLIPAAHAASEPRHPVKAPAQAPALAGSQVPLSPAVDAGRNERQLPQPAPEAVKNTAASVLPPPPMEYRFAGKLLQNGMEQVFVTRGDTLIAVKPGDTLGSYVVRAISSSAIALDYPPSGHKESIAIPVGIAADEPVPSGSASDSVNSPR